MRNCSSDRYGSGRDLWVAVKTGDGFRPYEPTDECGPVTADQTAWFADSTEITADMTTTCELDCIPVLASDTNWSADSTIYRADMTKQCDRAPLLLASSTAWLADTTRYTADTVTA